MSILTLPKFGLIKSPILLDLQKQTARRANTAWEIIPLLVGALFFHFYHLDRVLFIDDQAGDFQRAYNAVAHGYWPITGNLGSLLYVHPPLSIYFFMLPALFSSDPFGGEILVAAVNTTAILLTYCFVRRYYGRLAGTIASLLYVTSVGAWSFSRDIWSPDFLPFFVLIFFWMLFRGVVDRRQGWLGPAIVLLGALYQLHESAVLSGICLLVAVIFAYKTIRVRDLILGVFLLLCIFTPYLIWEFHVRFYDILGSLHSRPSSDVHNFYGFDLEIFGLYRFFLEPTITNPYTNWAGWASDNHLLPSNIHSLFSTTPLYYFQFLLVFSDLIMPFLLILSLLGLSFAELFPLHIHKKPRTGNEAMVSSRPFDFSRMVYGIVNCHGVSWSFPELSPARQGLTLLLLWQTFPLFYLTHHNIVLFTHYALFMLPGPFILVGIGLARMAGMAGMAGVAGAADFVPAVHAWYPLRLWRPTWQPYIKVGVLSLAGLLIWAQLLGLTVSLFDQTHGNIRTDMPYGGVQFSDLEDIQHTLRFTDQYAQAHHIHRIYANSDFITNKPMKTLLALLQTPGTTFDPNRCIVLPGVGAGPVLFVTIKLYPLQDELLRMYTHTTLLSQIGRLAHPEAPFQVFLVTANQPSQPAFLTSSPLNQVIQPVETLASNISYANNAKDLNPNLPLLHARALVTHWQIQETHPSSLLSAYDYRFHFLPDNISNNCSLSATWAGDQLFTYEQFSSAFDGPGYFSVQVSTSTEVPQLIHRFGLTLETSYTRKTQWQTVRTSEKCNCFTFTNLPPW